MKELDERAARLVGAAADRRGQKRHGPALDDDPALRRAVIALARARGVSLPVEAERWPGKRLLRRAQGRETPARTRENPIRRDEPFTCLACGLDVPAGGARVRDHCPRCLVSLHVDRVPGDRAAGCEGLLRPVGLELVAGEAVLRYRCERCGHRHRARAHPDDDPAALARVSAEAE